MLFSRSPSGLAAWHLFYPKIAVFVEGNTDIPFYEEVLQNYNCQIIPRNGREECEKLAAALAQANYPYVVILDGDYEILERTRSKHRRVILLHRYSFENYLFEEEPIQQFCRDCARKLVDRFWEIVTEIEQKLEELVVLDVAHRRSKTGHSVLTDSPERFFEIRSEVNFRDDQIQQRCTEAVQRIGRQSIEEARTLVGKFLRERRFIDLLPGHFAFGIIRGLIVNTVGESISKREIRLYLSRVVWRLVKTPDHNSLKTRLCRAVREAQKIPRSGKGAQG